jgi:hypothetical protein
MKQRLAVLVALTLLAGCGGGGGNSVPAAAGAKSQPQTKGSVIISIPTSGAAASSAKVRYPQFVSPSAQSVALSVNGAADTIFDVSTTSPLCTTVSGTRNCTLAFGAPVGSDTFAFLIFAGPNGTGTQLAAATSSQTIATGTAFNFTVALNAVIGTIVANIPTHGGTVCPNAPPNFNGIAEGCAGSAAPASITAFDPSGATITGTAPYATPITITASDPSLSASPSTVTAPGQTVVLSYSGAPFASGVTNTATVSLTVGTQVIPAPVGVLRSYLYVANSNAPIGQTPAGGGNVAVYAFGASGSAAPVRLLSGANTQIKTPAKAISDLQGNVYVIDNGVPSGPNFNGNILMFATGQTGNVAPAKSINNMGSLTNQPCSDMVFDPTATYLFVACGSQINVFPVTSLLPTGNLASNASTAQLVDEAVGTHTGLAFDPSGNLYISDDSENQILMAPTTVPTTGGFHPTIGLSTTILAPSASPPPGSWNAGDTPQSMVIDTSGTLYAPVFFLSPTSGVGDNTAELGIWSSGALGMPCVRCAPSVALAGAPFTTHAVTGVALDPAGNVYVSNAISGGIAEFARATVAASANNAPQLRTLTNTGNGQATSPIGLWVGP